LNEISGTYQTMPPRALIATGLSSMSRMLSGNSPWTALKEGKEFLRAEDAKDEVIKLFKENKGDGEEERSSRRVETDKLPF
jgi:hypothetical protein